MMIGPPNMTFGVREGDVLAGKYRISEIIGAGGMGVVVAAHHLHLDEKVAIKFLLPDALMDTEAVARFAREAKAAVKIKSEHVARVIDVGTLQTGAPYIVMEFLEGSDLSVWIRQRGALPIHLTAEFVLQACDAIADAHSLGIIHRDLKPSNLFCIRRNDGSLSIKVLDFGISKITGHGASADMSMTKTATTLGSPYYMSPEQAQSARDVDARSDIWALGVILYELATGRVPFGGVTMPEVVLKIATAAPPSFRELRLDGPDGFEAVILRCLEKDRSRRYQNVAELAVALAEFASMRGQLLIERIRRVIQGVAVSASLPSMSPSSIELPAGAAPATTTGIEGAALPSRALPLALPSDGAPGALSAATVAPLGQTKRPGARRARRKTLTGLACGALLLAVVAAILVVMIQGRPPANGEIEPKVAAGSTSAQAAPSSSQVPAASAAGPAGPDTGDSNAAGTEEGVAASAVALGVVTASAGKAKPQLPDLPPGTKSKPPASPSAGEHTVAQPPGRARGRGGPADDNIKSLIGERQ